MQGRPAYRSQRLLDLAGGTLGTLLSLPAIAVCAAVIFVADRHNPFYVSERIGRGGHPIRFVKIRTMVPNASATKVDTTTDGDPRLLPAGRILRRLKFDELPQFWLVLGGSMSLVGPRPNVAREVNLYTPLERGLLSVRPGLTDYASIVFADLGALLAGASDANVAYNQMVRPWKSALGLHYVAHRSAATDVRLLVYTITNVFARRWTLERIAGELEAAGADPDLVRVARRTAPPPSAPPPGATEIVTRRDVP